MAAQPRLFVKGRALTATASNVEFSSQAKSDQYWLRGQTREANQGGAERWRFHYTMKTRKIFKTYLILRQLWQDYAKVRSLTSE